MTAGEHPNPTRGEAAPIPARACAGYTDPRLAAVYDPLNPPDESEAFYRRRVGAGPGRLLEIGCGTGRLSVDLAAQGWCVTGLDPTPAMLAIARARPGGETVTWVEGTAPDLPDALPQDARFDVAVMTGHVSQVFLTDAEASATLEAVRACLRPGGRLLFETRNPLVREWESWTEAESAEEVAVPGVGPVRVHYQWVGRQGDCVTFDTRFAFGPDDVAVARHTLRFPDDRTVERLLTAAGLSIRTCFGDWDERPFTPDAPELIFEAVRA